MSDLEFIKGFTAIKLSKIVRSLNIDYGNLLNGKTTKDNIKKVRDAIENEIDNLMKRRE